MKTMTKVEEYIILNILALNAEKSQVMLVTNKKELKESFEVKLNGKNVKHKNEVIILGNTMSSTLTWDAHIRKVLIPALSNRVRTLRLISKYLGKGFRAIYANAIFCSKFMFGIETWGGAQK